MAHGAISETTMSPELSVCRILDISDATGPKEFNMPQMFDWIFYAIMIPFPAFLLWDWLKNR
ncbi:hypothetical protein OPKNFCMD_2504 [Methylobacterium crusticola]|uniref:Uncharacterized protein n=2 Tax=Methylobacterium crusticola TaxID=1697972 RepID=A0ABQ4QWN8_9HYPH|nr:hypothetical protein OPKNFCMD_2504 [Methylobacterium crusticola]